MKKISIITLFFLFITQTYAQILSDTVFSPKVRAVKLFLNDDQLSYPVLTLNSGNKLTLRFDILGDEREDLQYSVVHCDWNWEESGLSDDEYIEGYYFNDIYDYENSFNTMQPYVNYEVVLPNDDMKFILSGNYVVKVFLSDNPDSVLLQKRFVVVENMAIISANVHQASDAAYRMTHQEVDFNVSISGLNLQNPAQYVKAAVYQNFRFDNAKYFDEAKYYQGDRLIYDFEDINLFEGGNEFRIFDVSDFKYLVQKVYKYVFVDSFYHCYLISDNRHYAHSSVYDQNGMFAIGAKRGLNPWYNADYVYVYFTLLSRSPISGGDVYVFGQLTDWKIDPRFKMEYVDSLKAYRSKVFLKQGMYNYSYIFVPDKGKPTFNGTEGNFYQTRNDYLIFVYYREQSPYYDRVIGYYLKH